MRISDEIGAKTPNIGVARAMEQWAGVEARGPQSTSS